MTITKLSLEVASEISSGARFDLCRFFENAKPGEVLDFCHYHFYYSYPEFGKKWKDEQICQYHEVTTQCIKCQAQPERNYAGVGSLFLSIREDRKASLLCMECAKGMERFGEVKRFVQMELF